VDAVSAAASIEEDSEGTFVACMDTMVAVSEDTLWTVVHAAVDEGASARTPFLHTARTVTHQSAYRCACCGMCLHPLQGK
jgi:hypothetical protein